MTVQTKQQSRLRRRRRVRAKIRGSAERPRLSVYRSNRGLFVQLVDDDAGHTVAAVNWIEKDVRGKAAMEQAKRCGELLAERAKQAGVTEVRVRPRRVPVPRPRQGARRGRARGRPGILSRYGERPR